MVVKKPPKDLNSFEGRKWLQQISFASSGLESDPHYSGSPASGITNSNIAQWNEAYSWGDHGEAGYLPILIVIEAPTGTINGANQTFFLLKEPRDDSVLLQLNGVIMVEESDYTLSGRIITLVEAPVVGDYLLARYLEA